MAKELFVESALDQDIDEAKAKRGRKGAGEGKPRNAELKQAKRFINQYKSFLAPVMIPNNINKLIQKKGDASAKKALVEYEKILQLTEDAYITKNSGDRELSSAKKNNSKFTNGINPNIKSNNKYMKTLKGAFLGVMSSLMFMTSMASDGVPIPSFSVSQTVAKHQEQRTTEVKQIYKDAASSFDYAKDVVDDIWSKTLGNGHIEIGGFTLTNSFNKLAKKGSSHTFLDDVFFDLIIAAADAGYSAAELDELGFTYINIVEDISNIKVAPTADGHKMLLDLKKEMKNNFKTATKNIQNKVGYKLTNEDVKDRVFGQTLKTTTASNIQYDSNKKKVKTYKDYAQEELNKVIKAEHNSKNLKAINSKFFKAKFTAFVKHNIVNNGLSIEMIQDGQGVDEAVNYALWQYSQEFGSNKVDLNNRGYVYGGPVYD